MIQLYLLFPCIDVLPFLLCYSIYLHFSLKLISLSYLAFFKLCIKYFIFSISPFPFASHLSTTIVIVSSVNHFITFLFFTYGIHFKAVSIIISRITIHISSAFLPSNFWYYESNLDFYSIFRIKVCSKDSCYYFDIAFLSTCT